MTEVESAALMLAGTLLAGIAIAVAIWRARRPAASPRGVPRAPGPPRARKLPKLPRKAPEVAEVAIAPSRLARVSGKAPLDPPRDVLHDDALEADIAVETMAAAVAGVDTARKPAVAGVEAAAVETVTGERTAALTLHLVPQIPLRDAISTHSWLGGRPRLATGMAWPQIDDQPADFLAQIGCADLPRDIWGGLGHIPIKGVPKGVKL